MKYIYMEADYNINLDDKGLPVEAYYSEENEISSLNKKISNEKVKYAVSKPKIHEFLWNR